VNAHDRQLDVRQWPPTPGRVGWLLPYATVAAVVVADAIVGHEVNLTPFLVLAPVLASRLLGRTHVALAGVAALSAGILLGFLDSVNVAGAFTPQQVLGLVLIVLGTLIALITQGAYEREQSTLARARNTISLASSLVAGVEPQEAYALLARSARTLYAAQLAAVYRFDGERMTLWRDDRDPALAPLPGRFGPVTFPDAFGEQPTRVRAGDRGAPEAAVLHARDLRTLLWLPLRSDGVTVGTLALAWRSQPRLSAADLEASSRFAELGARAIVGSERVRSQADVLRRVLALLLSVPPPRLHGWEIRVRYESASQLAQIGGDFYDVAEVGDDALAFVVADSRGKGLEASSLAAVLKGGFRSLAGDRAGPRHILERLDELVRREGGDEDFVTALVGTVGADGHVVLASAGHPLPFGVPIEPVEVGPPLGLGFGAGAGEVHVRLRPGDRLVCFTDGLIEARNPAGEFIEPAKLRQALAEERLEAVLDRLVGAVTEHVQGRLRDDLALLGLEYAPGSSTEAAGSAQRLA
jgi:hypothetical protein